MLSTAMKKVDPKSTTRSSSGVAPSSCATTLSGASWPSDGFVTDKLYGLVRVFLLQNDILNPSPRLLEYFADLARSNKLPGSRFLHRLMTTVALNPQCRLILKENGKLIIPYEHFRNAAMFKHISGGRGLHLGVDDTIKAVKQFYTVGKEQYGMEKELIRDVVLNCPNKKCHFLRYKEFAQESIHPAQRVYIPDPSLQICETLMVEAARECKL